MASAAKVAYCTLLTSDEYLPGAMVLAHSLRNCGTKVQLAILVTLDSLQEATITELKKVYGQIIPVEPIINKAPANLYLMGRPDLVSTFTKIQLWKQTQYDHLIYIDGDVVALKAPDELFLNPPDFAAAPDIGWPDCFNSGVLSLKPNMGDYYALLALANRGISFDGADQGLLNMHFQEWERLSFAYNCTPSGNYQYVPAYRHFQSSISLVHYIGPDKPWIVGRNNNTATGVYEELLGRWWAVYDRHYRLDASQTTGRSSKGPMTVQQYVTGEVKNGAFGFSSKQAGKLQESEDGEAARDYSAEWDAQHQPPPAHSRPEAANFPHQVYKMSADPSLFHAPQNPQPPGGMYYEVPKDQPTHKLPPIFPWELHQSKASRIFPEDVPPKPAPPLYTPSVTTDSNDETSSTSGPSTPTTNFSTSGFSRTNAWDEMPEISRYISNLPQNRRAKIQVLTNNQVLSPPLPGMRTPTGNTDTIQSPTQNNDNEVEDPRNRRPSMKLTDFPTEFERPSLPVTPAPIQRPSFWGSERDAAGDLPPAEGVPTQSEWNPAERLVELARRQSKVLEAGGGGVGGGGRDIPDREMLPSASRNTNEGITKEAVIEEEQPQSQSQSRPETGSTSEPAPGLVPAPVFGTLNFAGGGGHIAAADGGEEGGQGVAPEEEEK